MRKTLAILLLAGTTFLGGCGDSNDDFVFTPQNPGAGIVAPMCQDDDYITNQNAQLSVNAANGVLANDTPNGGTLAFAATSAQGGTITGNADGSFVYSPATNFSGTDSFTYTLTNDGGQVTCTVTITVQAVNGYFVDSVNGNDGTGSFQGGLPFATIQAAAAAAPAGSDIVVRPGNYTGAIALENGDRLLGSGSALAQGTAVRPVLTGPIDLADGNTVDFLRIANAPDDAIDGDGQNGGTITNCEIDTTANLGSGLQARQIEGNWVFSNNTVNNVTGIGAQFTTEGTDIAVVRINNNVITNSDFNAIGFTTSNSSELTAQVTGNTMTGNQTGFTFEVIAGQTSTSCFDIEGNTNDDTYKIAGNSTHTGTLEVEQYDPNSTFIAINNNSGTVTVPGGSTAPMSVNDGACGF